MFYSKQEFQENNFYMVLNMILMILVTMIMMVKDGNYVYFVYVKKFI